MASMPIGPRELAAQPDTPSNYITEPSANAAQSQKISSGDANTISSKTITSIAPDAEDTKSVTGVQDDIEKSQPPDGSESGPEPKKKDDFFEDDGKKSAYSHTQDQKTTDIILEFPDGGLRAWSVVLGVSY